MHTGRTVCASALLVVAPVFRTELSAEARIVDESLDRRIDHFYDAANPYLFEEHWQGNRNGGGTV